MTDPVRTSMRHLMKFAFVFVLLSLPSFALRLWHPQPLGGFPQGKIGQIEAVLRHPPAVRMALAGSSKIWTALDAPSLSQALYGEPDAVLNFGVIRRGRGRDFFLVREILKIETIEHLVIEVGYDEQNQVHRDFHRLASLTDTFHDPYNRPSTPSSPSEWRGRIRFMVTESLGNSAAGYGQAFHRIFVRLRYGSSVPGNFYETGGSARSTQRMPEAPAAKTYVPHASDPRERANRYLSRIAELCRDRGVELIALEIPTYGDPRMSSDRRSFLEDIGTTVVSHPRPAELFVPGNWFDQRHMNVWGAEVFTDGFVEQLQALELALP